MNDMTDAEFMRKMGSQGRYPETCRLNAIADLLDAMQWRSKPPNTEGDWVLSREGGFAVLRVRSLKADLPPRGLPGDLWFKLPVTK